MTGSKSSTKSRARGEAKQNEKPMTRTKTKSSIKSSTKPHPPDIPDRSLGLPDTGGIGAWTDEILTTSSYSPDTECLVFYYDSSPVQGEKRGVIEEEDKNAMGDIELGQNHEVWSRSQRETQIMDDDIGPFNSSRGYFHGIQQELNTAIKEDYHDEEDWPQWSAACEAMVRAIPSMIDPRFRRSPFLLHHPDFHFVNILVDDDFNITGVLDWSNTRAVPVERFAAYQEFMTYPRASEEVNRPIIEFRKLFIDALRRLEEASNPNSALSDLFDSTLPEVVHRWDKGIPHMAPMASFQALWVLRLLYGNDTTFENYKARQKQHGRKGRLKLGSSRGAEFRMSPIVAEET